MPGVVDTAEVSIPSEGVFRVRANFDECRVIAVIPEDQVLYIVEEKDSAA